MAKLKFIETGYQEYALYDTELNKKIIFEDVYCDLDDGRKIKRCYDRTMCNDRFRGGTQLLEMNNDTKLILEYDEPIENAPWRVFEKFNRWGSTYEEKNGKITNVIPVKDIVKYAKRITAYTTSGKLIFSITRDRLINKCKTKFDLKFNDNDFVLLISYDYGKTIELEKTIYSYGGEILQEKHKKININDLVEKAIKDDCF